MWVCVGVCFWSKSGYGLGLGLILGQDVLRGLSVGLGPVFGLGLGPVLGLGLVLGLGVLFGLDLRVSIGLDLVFGSG